MIDLDAGGLVPIEHFEIMAELTGAMADAIQGREIKLRDGVRMLRDDIQANFRGRAITAMCVSLLMFELLPAKADQDDFTIELATKLLRAAAARLSAGLDQIRAKNSERGDTLQ